MVVADVSVVCGALEAREGEVNAAVAELQHMTELGVTMVFVVVDQVELVAFGGRSGFQQQVRARYERGRHVYRTVFRCLGVLQEGASTPKTIKPQNLRRVADFRSQAWCAV